MYSTCMYYQLYNGLEYVFNLPEETLKCPLNNKGNTDKSEAYATILSNVNSFRDITGCPFFGRHYCC